MICLEVGVKLVAASVKEGAKILIGGKQIESRGYFHRPIILKNVTPKNAYSTGRGIWPSYCSNCCIRWRSWKL